MNRCVFILLLVGCRASSNPSRSDAPAALDVEDHTVSSATPVSSCGDAAGDAQREIHFVNGLNQRGLEPPDVFVFGAQIYKALFTLTASGESPDIIACKSGMRGSTEMWLECLDGQVKKSALVQLDGENLSIAATAGTVQTRANLRVPPCTRLVADLTTVSPPKTAAPEALCGDSGVGPLLDVRIQRGPKHAGGGPIELVVPSLGIRRVLGTVAAPERCRTDVVGDRRWMSVTCIGAESGLAAKVIVTDSHIVIVKSESDREYIRIPCHSRATVHGLSCVVDCNGVH